MNSITSSQDIIDSRDIEERIAELERDKEEKEEEVSKAKEALQDFLENHPHPSELETSGDSDTDLHVDDSYEETKGELETTVEAAEQELAEWLDDQEGRELKSLEELRDEVGSAEFRHGISFIRDSYFVKYVEEIAADFGFTGSLDWIVVDWDKTADNVQQDYSSVEFDGETYWYRN